MDIQCQGAAATIGGVPMLTYLFFFPRDPVVSGAITPADGSGLDDLDFELEPDDCGSIMDMFKIWMTRKEQGQMDLGGHAQSLNSDFRSKMLKPGSYQLLNR